jgi:CDP-glucose 4,6-dehydratase
VVFAGTPVLVTGAQGFVGSWLAERLLAEGARVVVPRRDVDPESRFRTEGIEERCHVVACEVTDYESVLRVLNEEGVRAVFHLAAQTIVGVARRSPLSTFESNVRGTWIVLEACRALGVVGAPVERVVVASSDKAYGAQDELPYREGSPLSPLYPYDVSKAAADMIARSYAATWGMPVAVTRLANVYGGGDLNWSRAVPDTCRALARGERPVIRSDGTPERDYLYVEDAVGAYLAVAESLDREELRGRAWNAGWGRPVAVRELVDRLIAVAGRDVEPDVRGAGTPAGEIDRQYLDSSAIREQLGWAPRVQLDDGLARTWSWYERRLSQRARAAPGGQRTRHDPG